MAHDVFISYSHHDKAVADAICATLEAHKVRCWYAPRDIVAGLRWGEAIIEAIGRSSVMVLVFSTKSNLSDQVLNEVERAVSKGVDVLPFRIEDVMPSPALELYVSGRHWLDAMTPPLERHLQRLADAIASHLVLRLQPADSTPSPSSDVNAIELDRKIEASEWGINTVAFLQDGRRVLSAGEDGAVRLWDVASGTETQRLTLPAGQADGVKSAAITADGSRLLVAAETNGVVLLDLASERVILSSPAASPLTAIDMSASGKRAIAAGEAGFLALYDLQNGHELRRLSGHTKDVYHCAIAPDGRVAVSGGADLTLRLWDIETGQQLDLISSGGPFSSAMFSRDGKRVVAGGSSTTALFGAFRQADGTYVRLTSAPDKKSLVMESAENVTTNLGTLQVLEVHQQRLIPLTSARLGEGICAIALSPDESLAALGVSIDPATPGLAIWHIGTQRILRAADDVEDMVTVAFSPDGTKLASGTPRGSVYIWSLG